MLLKEIMKQKLTIKISRRLLRKIFHMKISSVFIEKISNQMVQLLYVYLAINITTQLSVVNYPCLDHIWSDSRSIGRNRESQENPYNS